MVTLKNNKSQLIVSNKVAADKRQINKADQEHIVTVNKFIFLYFYLLLLQGFKCHQH
jgi:hypothetical protein